MTPARLCVALDTADPAQASRLVALLRPHVDLFKIGLEFFAAHGPAGVAALGAGRVFLDLKLHDIPATVAGATRAVGGLHPAMLTVHAAGGAAMVAAAREALGDAEGRTRLLAVTVLTSLDPPSLAATGCADPPAIQVGRLAALALAAGADGLVCAAAEVADLRARFGPDVVLVVPGLRPHDSATDDQARTATPAAAAAAGASVLVIGRPITAAADPGVAAAAIRATLFG